MAELTLKTLQTAVKGLLYPSEQDRPVKAVFWPQASLAGATLTANLIRTQTQASAAAKITTQSAADFFEPVTTAQSWHSDDEKAAVQQFQALQSLLQGMQDLTVFCVGDTEQQLYVVGHTDGGDVAGITTRVVET